MIGGLICFHRVIRSRLHTEGLVEIMTMMMGLTKATKYL
jgi:hypothetical protein